MAPTDEAPPGSTYKAYWATAELNTPRYLHEGFLASSGLVYVFGGSDERGLASLDTVEIYDQSTFDENQPRPESGDGIWVDTNFEGDPITMIAGSRLFMTLTELSNNTVLMIGGTTNVGAGLVYGKAEVFDPETRVFESVDQEMLNPRFRHTVVPIATGELLIVGGQVQATITVVNEDIAEGQPNRQMQVTVFPSTELTELFSPRDDSFTRLLSADGQEAMLQTQRGRAGHAMTRIAGPDNRLATSDDIYMIVGGFQTLSAVSNMAPRSKRPGVVNRGEGDALTTIEVYDPQTNIFTLIASVRLNAGRVHYPQAVNLGDFNDFTPDGVRGMGNVILVTHGNDDRGPDAEILDQLFIANYTPGGGPAQGVRFFEVEELRFFSHVQGTEYVGAVFPQFGLQVSRSGTNVVTLPRPLATVPGVPDQATWAFAIAGVDLFAGAVNYDSPMMLAGCVFDPFFSLRSAFLFNLEPTDLENERRTEPFNFLGVVGVWMTIDGDVSRSIDDFSTTPANRWGQHQGEQRVFHKLIQLPGVDGIPNTFDDRLLLAGGGKSYPDNGGEPTSPSSEIFLPPGSSQQQQ